MNKTSPSRNTSGTFAVSSRHARCPRVRNDPGRGGTPPRLQARPRNRAAGAGVGRPDLPRLGGRSGARTSSAISWSLFAAYWLWRRSEFSRRPAARAAAACTSRSAAIGSPRARTWLALGGSHHLVIVPTYRESDAILAETLACLAQPDRAARAHCVVLAFEERDPHAPRARGAPEPAFRHLVSAHWLVTSAPRSARRSQGQIVEPGLGGATGRGRADRHRPARPARPAGDRAATRIRGCDPQFLAALGHKVLTPSGRPLAHLPAGHPVLCQSRATAAAAARGEQRVLAVLAGAVGGQPSPGPAVDVLAQLVGGAAGRRSGTSTSSPKTRTCSSRCGCTSGRACKTRAIYLPVYADAAEGATCAGTARQHRTTRSGAGRGASRTCPYLALRSARARGTSRGTRASRAWAGTSKSTWCGRRTGSC